MVSAGVLVSEAEGCLPFVQLRILTVREHDKSIQLNSISHCAYVKDEVAQQTFGISLLEAASLEP